MACTVNSSVTLLVLTRSPRKGKGEDAGLEDTCQWKIKLA